MNTLRETFTREEIIEALTIEPCHITGTHDPVHTLKYICRDQLAVGHARLLALLGITTDELPRRLDPECGWCQRDSDEIPLLTAWAGRKPMTFTLHELMSDHALDAPSFSTYSEAWNTGLELTRDHRGFSVYVTVEGLDAPRRIGHFSPW